MLISTKKERTSPFAPKTYPQFNFFPSHQNETWMSNAPSDQSRNPQKASSGNGLSIPPVFSQRGTLPSPTLLSMGGGCPLPSMIQSYWILQSSAQTSDPDTQHQTIHPPAVSKIRPLRHSPLESAPSTASMADSKFHSHASPCGRDRQ